MFTKLYCSKEWSITSSATTIGMHGAIQAFKNRKTGLPAKLWPVSSPAILAHFLWFPYKWEKVKPLEGRRWEDRQIICDIHDAMGSNSQVYTLFYSVTAGVGVWVLLLLFNSPSLFLYISLTHTHTRTNRDFYFFMSSFFSNKHCLYYVIFHYLFSGLDIIGISFSHVLFCMITMPPHCSVGRTYLTHSHL